MNDIPNGGGKKPLAVYAILERKDRPAYWLKVGAAWANRDGSTTLVLDAVPIGTNRLQIREAKTWDEVRPANGAAQATAAAEVMP